MATLVVTLALFLLFSPSQSLPRDDGGLLLLPSDNPRSAALADPTSAVEDPQPSRDGFVSLPLTKIDFHEGSVPFSLRFPHRRHFGRGFRRGFMRPRGQKGMLPRQISYGNDMILSDGKDASQEFVRRSRFHWVNRRPGFEVSAPWKGEEEGLFQRPKGFEHGRDVEDEDVFKRPKKFKHGHHDDDDEKEDEEMFKRPPKKFRHHHHHHDEDDVFKRPKKFDHDDEFRPLETVSKVKHEDDDLVFRMPRKFKHHDDDHDDDWHREKKHHHHHFGHHHHKHHHDDDDNNKGGVFSKMRKFFDDLF